MKYKKDTNKPKEKDKTVNDLIKELQGLKPSLREKPVVVMSPNGLINYPEIKRIPKEIHNPFCEDKAVLLSFD